MKLQALFKEGFKQKLLKLQQDLIDMIDDDDASVDVVTSRDGMHLDVKLGERVWSVKPSDFEGKMFSCAHATGRCGQVPIPSATWPKHSRLTTQKASTELSSWTTSGLLPE